MPKKAFEETPYDPIAADLIREVTAARPTATSPQRRSIFDGHVEMFRTGVPHAAVSEPSVPSHGPRATPHGAREPSIAKRFLLTRSESEELDAFLLRLQKCAGTKVTLSMFTRATLNVAMQAEELLLAEVGTGLPRRFPSTHDSIAQGAFEEWWMRCLSHAFRKLPRTH